MSTIDDSGCPIRCMEQAGCLEARMLGVPPSEVAVPKAGYLVGGGVFLDRLDRLLYKQLY